jgi:hypothetical protein
MNIRRRKKNQGHVLTFLWFDQVSASLIHTYQALQELQGNAFEKAHRLRLSTINKVNQKGRRFLDLSTWWAHGSALLHRLVDLRKCI